MSINQHIQLQSLKKVYSEGEKQRAVLAGLNLSIAEGEMVVLLGRSGSGKSTLLNLISGIDRPDEGHITIGSTELTTLSEKQRTLFRRTHIGFIFQSFNLISTLTARENVLLPLRLKGDDSDTARQTVNQFLQEVGLGDRGDSYPDRLSGGEQQRVAIARALAATPDLILADEPTGNLDYETGRTILDLLERLVREQNRTMLIATHDRDICAIADRVLELKGGALEPWNRSTESASA